VTLPEPSRRLPKAARTYWRLSLAGQALVPLLISLALAELWAELGIPVVGPVLAVVVAGLAAVLAVPEVRWRRWRYEVREDEIDLRHGTFTVRRTLVPIRRVQHVDTRSGLVQGSLDLATVSFATAAGRTEIPALTKREAEDVRRRVAELARTRDDT
jgi:membrane protein YdbS with pleckstrin-like domain